MLLVGKGQTEDCPVAEVKPKPVQIESHVQVPSVQGVVLYSVYLVT